MNRPLLSSFKARDLHPRFLVGLVWVLSMAACSDRASVGEGSGGSSSGGDSSGGATSPAENGGAVAGSGGRPTNGGAGDGGASSGGSQAGGNGAGGAVGATGGSESDGNGGSAVGGAGSGGGGLAGGGQDGSGGTPPVDQNALFAAPSGSVDAAGTLGDPLSLGAGLERLSAGETLYLRGGTYRLMSTLNLTQDGTSASPVVVSAYPLDSERPLLDFSSMSENSSNRGLILSGDYWHIYGIDVFAAGDNGMFVGGSHNTVEFSSFFECADTGLQLGGGATDNLILNCDSYFNADSSLENADGFAAKLDVGSGNRFVGCRAWNNLDDGWDGYLRPANNITTTYEDCWAIDNGKLKDGSEGAGDGNGFKTGGSDDKDLSHDAVYHRCIAAGNVHDGFDHNSNRGNVTILNSAAHSNGSNINFSASNIAASLTIKNTISLGTNGTLSATITSIQNNSWQNALSATNSDFVSVDISQLKGPRKADGSLPDVEYLRLVQGSDLIDAGVDVGLDFEGSAPDLGPFEATP